MPTANLKQENGYSFVSRHFPCSVFPAIDYYNFTGDGRAMGVFLRAQAVF